jgi:hypothetical protein
LRLEKMLSVTAAGVLFGDAVRHTEVKEEADNVAGVAGDEAVGEVPVAVAAGVRGQQLFGSSRGCSASETGALAACCGLV